MAHSFTSPRPLLGETDMRPLHSQIKPLLGDVDNRKLRRLGSQPIHPHKTNGGLPFEIEDPYSISSDSKPFLDETLKGDAIPTCEGRTGTDATPTNIKVAARSSAQPPSPNDRTSADGDRLRVTFEPSASPIHPRSTQLPKVQAAELVMDENGRWKKPPGEPNTSSGFSLDGTMNKYLMDWEQIRNSIERTVERHLDYSKALTHQDPETVAAVQKLLEKEHVKLANDYVKGWPIYQAMKVKLKSTVQNKTAQPAGLPIPLPGHGAGVGVSRTRSGATRR